MYTSLNEVHAILGEGFMCAREGLRGRAGFMCVCLWLCLLMMEKVCQLSRDLVVTSWARNI